MLLSIQNASVGTQKNIDNAQHLPGNFDTKAVAEEVCIFLLMERDDTLFKPSYELSKEAVRALRNVLTVEPEAVSHTRANRTSTMEAQTMEERTI